jgi:exodeoxyribonuclease VII small subunit
MATKKPGKPTFEDSLHRLEEIVEQLEQGEVPLEESIKMYEEGLTLSRECMEKLAQAELKLKKLSKSMDGTLQLDDDSE